MAWRHRCPTRDCIQDEDNARVLMILQRQFGYWITDQEKTEERLKEQLAQEQAQANDLFQERGELMAECQHLDAEVHELEQEKARLERRVEILEQALRSAISNLERPRRIRRRLNFDNVLDL